MKSCCEPSSYTTVIVAPTEISASLAKRPVTPRQLRCPAMTAEPGSPGDGPCRYHTRVRASGGTSSSLAGLTPAGSTGPSIAELGDDEAHRRGGRTSVRGRRCRREYVTIGVIVVVEGGAVLWSSSSIGGVRAVAVAGSGDCCAGRRLRHRRGGDGRGARRDRRRRRGADEPRRVPARRRSRTARPRRRGPATADATVRRRHGSAHESA